MSACGEIIERSMTSWLCDLPLGHDGPPMAHGDAKSVRERLVWEKAQVKAQEPKLSELQGEPQTTAQRYTENPTDHPAVAKAHQEDASVQPDGPRVKDLILENPDAKICKSCFDGEHLGCVHRAELIAVTYYNKEQLEQWCSCIQQDRVAHGVGEDTGGSPPTPGVDIIQGHSGADYAAEQAAVPKTSAPAVGDLIRKLGGEDVTDIPTLDEFNQLSQPTKQRPGDQGLPRATGGEVVQERMISKAQILHSRGDITDAEFDFIQESMKESIRVGVERYGSPLQTFNGRKTLQDAEDEARDWFVYLSALNQAAEASREQMIGLCGDAVKAANEEGDAMGLTQVVTIVVDTILGAVGVFDNIKARLDE